MGNECISISLLGFDISFYHINFLKIAVDLKHTCIMYINIRKCAVNLIWILMKASKII